MSDKYILEGHKVVPYDDLLKWAIWMEDNDTQVDRTILSKGILFWKTYVKISTVFLGLDHNFEETGEHILFETIIFGGALDEEMERYSTWKQAEEGHKKWVEKVKQT